jgi:antitoxin component YwqK of YwqJK toxin-antitoxin module
MHLNYRCPNGSTLILIFLLFQIASCKKPVKKIIGRYADGTPGVVYEYADKGDTSNYISKDYYPNGRIRRIAIVTDGQVTGKVTTFHENGKISQIDSLLHPRKIIDDGDWDADVTSFYDNGVISEKFEIRHGFISGLSKYYDKRGILVKEYYLIRDTIKDGEYREFYDNGRTSFKATYRNDSLVGTEYYFKDNGDTLKYCKIENGRESLPYKRWLDNGNILEGNFVDTSEKAVIWKWYRDGKEIKMKSAKPTNGVFINPEPNY